IFICGAICSISPIFSAAWFTSIKRHGFHVLQRLNHEIAPGRAARNKNRPDGLVVLRFEKIDGGAQLAAQRMERCFQMRLHLGRHAYLDVLSFDVSDVDSLSQGASESIAADGDD